MGQPHLFELSLMEQQISNRFCALLRIQQSMSSYTRKESSGNLNKVIVSSKMMDHIDSALVPKTHTSVYLMHKYWARKPHNVVSRYIETYSKEGEIVLDPFCGSGVTAIESLKLARKAIAADLDPMAVFITRMTAIPIDIEEFKKTFNIIKKKVEDRIVSFYKTTCRRCQTEVTATHFIWEVNKNGSERPTKVWYKCSRCSKRTYQRENINKDDLQLLREIEGAKIPYWYPNNELIWNTRINVHKGMKVSDLFTKRALLGLSILYNEIEKIEDENSREMMRFVFSSALPQASNLVFVIERRGRQAGETKRTQEVGSWATRGYWIPPKHFEINLWNCFKNRFRKILRGKEDSNELIKRFDEAKEFNNLRDDRNILIRKANILELTGFIPQNSVDYVFTDPPYGDSVPYLELDYMWSSWLKFDADFENEIVMSDSPVRNKNLGLYEKMLNAAFAQVYRVLKPGRYMTVTFHNTDIKIWNCMIKAVVLSGFSLERIIYQPPARASAKGLLHPYESAVGDYYITFLKPRESKKLVAESELDRKKYERIVIETAKKLIAERGEPIPYQYVLNGVIPELNRHGVLLRGDRDIREIMKEHVDDAFVLIDVKNDKGKVINHKWWLKDPSSIPFLEIPLSERAEKAVINVLNRKIASFDDVLQEILVSFPNALTPDAQSIKECLDEYAKKTRDGRWRLKVTPEQMANQHTEIIYYLAKIGKKLGFEIWISQREQGMLFGSKRLSDLCDESSPTIRVTPSENLERIKQIDVLWYKDGEIKYEFEVENTTGITEAIVRGSNILTKNTKKFIVIPKERQNFLHRKLQEPIFLQINEVSEWNFMFYDDVKNLHQKRGMTVTDIDKTKRKLKSKKEIQQTLVDYVQFCEK